MEVIQSKHFVHVKSPYLAMALSREFPMIAQLGVESGGRRKQHMENNLLKPGRGITSRWQDRSSFGQSATLEHSGNQFRYAGGENLDWQIDVTDERTFVVRLKHKAGKVAGEFFRMSFAPAMCPVSVWGKWLTDKRFPECVQDRRSSFFQVPDVVVDYALPLLIHLPDYGALKVTCTTPGVTARQTMTADVNEVGLNLGCTNTGYHVPRRAYHCGTVDVSFHAASDVDELELTFSVEPEHFPQIAGTDFSDPKWNGLKRCWQNSFTLNPETLSMGDNPVLHGIAHLAIHFKSDMSVFTPPLLEKMTVHDVLRRQLEITFRDCVGESGEIHERHASAEGRKNGGDFGFFDANISNLIALYNYIAATGDWSIAKENLKHLRAAGRFLLALDRDGDGILELPFDGNAFRESRECRNWWDNFSFGHKDAFVNLLAYRGLGGLGEILAKLGVSDDAAMLADFRKRFASSFDRVFYNPRTGVHAGWISADGRVHDYMFTFVSSMAINEGLIEQAASRRILETLLAKLRDEGYGSWRWGIPGPLISVSESDGHIWAPMQRWGSYENGGFCGQTAYHFIQALYRSGMREQADEILFTMLDTFEHEATHSGVFPGYMRSVDWRTREGMPCGYNYLADNYYFLLAAITGHFGIPMPTIGNPR